MTNIVLFLQDAIKGMKSYGPRSLLTIDDTNIITGTLSLIRGSYRKAHITVIANFDPTRVKTKPYKNMDIIGASCAKDYLKSISVCDYLLFMNHDVVFNDYLLQSIPRDRSCLTFDNRPMSRNELCGLTQNNKVLRLAYGLDDKSKNVYTFSHIYGFTGKELTLFQEILTSPKYENFDFFEIVNLIIDEGGEFDVALDKKAKSLVINCPGDIKIASRLMR